MQGTFRDGDCLWVMPVLCSELRIGDVVAFRDDRKSVAHRIVGLDAAGWITRGDGNAHRDRRALLPEHVLGRVTARERAGFRSPVVGGSRGRLRACRLYLTNWLRRILFWFVASPYRLLRATDLIKLLWQPRIVRIQLSSEDGDFVKYVHQGRTVACWLPHARRWTCRKPYDLVLSPPG